MSYPLTRKLDFAYTNLDFATTKAHIIIVTHSNFHGWNVFWFDAIYKTASYIKMTWPFQPKLQICIF